MPFITEYYLDIKAVDGNTPVKRRVEFFKRSTHEHLLTIPALEIPNDGIIYTTKLATTIAAKDIYALMFDDVGNRQMAGADKLSIKSKQVWSDSTLLFHAEFTPGETTNERISGTPFVSTSKSAESTWLNGVLTTFPDNVPTITEKGLYVHSQITNYSKNNFQATELTTVTDDTYKSLTVKKARETAVVGTHKITNLFTSPAMTFDYYVFMTTYIRYIKPINSVNEITISILNNTDGIIGSWQINFLNKTVTCISLATGAADPNNNPVHILVIDPNFPDYYCLILNFTNPANSIISKEIISWTSLDYNLERGINLCNPLTNKDAAEGPTLLSLNVSTTCCSCTRYKFGRNL